MKQLVQDLVQELVKIDTTQGKCVAGINYLDNFLQSHGLNPEVDNYKEGEANLTVSIGPSGTEEFILSGHMDTVPIGDLAKWTHHPYSAKIIDGELWGRGSVDMKGGVGAITGAFLKLLQNESELKQKITLAISSEEELGLLGAAVLAEKGLMKNASHLIVAEPTALDVAVQEKGNIWFEIEAFGKQAHGARPDLGINAVEALAGLLPKIHQLLPKEEVPFVGKTTANIGMFNGGTAANVVPEYAKVSVDIRTIPGIDQVELKNEFQKCIEETESEAKFKLTSLHSVSSIKSPDLEFPKLIVNETKKFAPINENLVGVVYKTDATPLILNKCVPFAIFGPGSIDLLHQTDERLDLKQLEIATVVIENVLNATVL